MWNTSCFSLKNMKNKNLKVQDFQGKCPLLPPVTQESYSNVKSEYVHHCSMCGNIGWLGDKLDLSKGVNVNR